MVSRQEVGFAFEPEYSDEELAQMDADKGKEEAESSDETGSYVEGADYAAEVGRFNRFGQCQQVFV